MGARSYSLLDPPSSWGLSSSKKFTQPIRDLGESGDSNSVFPQAVKELKQKMVDSQRKMNIADMQINQHKVLVQKNALIKNVISTYSDDCRMFESVGRM